MKRLTAEEILDETIAFYGADPAGRRSTVRVHQEMTTTESCRYVSPEGNRCAVGRCLTERAAKEAARHHNTRSVGYLAEITTPWSSFDPLLRPRYRGHSLDFWSDLQALHDNEIYWVKGGGGLTPVGMDRAAKIREEYA